MATDLHFPSPAEPAVTASVHGALASGAAVSGSGRGRVSAGDCADRTTPVPLTMFESAGISNENDEWYTPGWVFLAIGVEFDLDPCSPGAPPSSVPARRHLTKADNGLSATWAGSVWLNPPFSSKRKWYEKLVAHGDGIALMPARTETHDLQDYMQAASALLFLKGRIYFERGSKPGANGLNGVTSTPPFGIVLCAYGDRMADALINSELKGVRARVIGRQP